MFNASHVCNPVAAICPFVTLMLAVINSPSILLAADAQCRLKAETEAIEVHVLKDGDTKWAGSIEKGDTKTISMPEGPFTLISKVYNPNLKRKEDIRAEVHTKLCEKQTLIVPLFPDSKQR